VLARPGLLLAVLALALNDHLLKSLWPGLVTGKLSDVSGLFAAPLVAWASLDLLGRRPTLRALAALAATTGAAFTLLKTWAPAREAYLSAYDGIGLPAGVVPDATDLLCLPVLALAWAYGARHLERPLPRGVGRAARAGLRWTVASSFAVLTVATSPLPRPRTIVPEVQRQEGPVTIVLDARRYVDRPYELTLPGGGYQALTVLERYHGASHTFLSAENPCDASQGEVDVEILLALAEGDPFLAGDPVRVPLPAQRAAWYDAPGEGRERELRREPAGEIPPCGTYQVRLVDAAGVTTVLELRFVGAELEHE
jgi:hypothetical protein